MRYTWRVNRPGHFIEVTYPVKQSFPARLQVQGDDQQDDQQDEGHALPALLPGAGNPSAELQGAANA